MRGNKLVNALAPLAVLVLAWSFNLGTVRGAAGTDGTPGREVLSTGDISDLDLDITSPLTGGPATDGTLGDNGGTGGEGLIVDADGAITDVELENSSTITGGSGGNGGDGSGGNGGNGGDGGDGIAFGADNGISHVQVENSGTSTGGNGGNGGNGDTGTDSNGGDGGGGGAGIAFGSDGPITDIELENSGTFAGGTGGTGGNGNGAGSGGRGGDGGDGIVLTTEGDISDIELENSGTVTGGNGGNGGTGGGAGGNGGDGGNGILLTSDSSISDVELQNSGQVAGGNGGNGGGGGPSGGAGGNGGAGGDGISLGSDGPISDVELKNKGTITGGLGGVGATGGSGSMGGDGGDGGDGVALSADTNISDVDLKNKGTIAGGNGGNGGDGSAADGGSGGFGGHGIEISAGSNLSDVELKNKGTITAGNGGNGGGVVGGTMGNGGVGGNGGDGIALHAQQNISGVKLKNKGTITAGNGGNGGDGGFGSNGGNGGQGGNGISLTGATGATGPTGSITGVKLKNFGHIAGGAGGNGGAGDSNNGGLGGNGGDGGAGILLSAKGNISHVKLENSSALTITGGNGGDGGSGGNGGNGGNAISLFTSGGDISAVALHNSGTIAGGNGGNGSNGFDVPSDSAQGSIGGEGGNGVLLESLSGNITAIELENSGTIAGGNGGTNTGGIFTEGGNGGNGVLFEAGLDVTNISLENEGTITGGNGGNNNDTSDDSIGGNGGHGIGLTAERNINNVALENSGTVTGGNGGNITTITTDIETGDPKAGDGGHGIFFSSGSETDADEFIAGSITNVTLINKAGGTVTGGDGGSASSGSSSTDDPHGGRGGDGISFSAGVNITDDGDDFPDTSIKNNINHVTLINRGTITGGGGGDGENGAATDSPLDLGGGQGEEGPDAGSVGGNGGHGVSFVSYTGDITDIFLRNFGTITGGDGGGAVGDIINTGGTGGNGINFHGGLTVSDVEDVGYSDDIRRVTVINDGTITGGDGGTANNSDSETGLGGNDGGNGGHGIAFTSTTGDISDITIFNCRTGSITGGNGGVAGDGNTETDFPNHGGDGGAGIYFSPGASGFDAADLSNITITNYGSVAGGEGADPGGTDSGGPFGNGGDGIFFDGGFGSNIVVNNFGSIAGGDAGDGGAAGAGIHSTVDNVTINNWGNISGGLDGFAPIPNAILITDGASNNTVNLRGFSVIHGLVEGEGGANNSNVLNFAFSGVNKAAAAALRAQLTTMGVLNGLDSSGSFTFRGETYQWDDIIVDVNTTSYQQQGITKNQKAIGRNLDGFTSTPSDDWRNLLAAVDTSGDVPDALNQLSPQRYQLYGDIAVANANYNTLGIDARLNNLRDGSDSIDTSCLRLASSKIESHLGFSKDDGGKNVVMARSNDGKTVELPTPEKEKRFGAFISGDIIQGNVDGRNADLEEDANFTTAGLMAGVDARLCKSLVAGLVFSYGHTNSDLDTQGSNVKVDTYSGGVYAGFQHGPWYANGLATYSANDYDSRRVTLPFLDCPPMQDRVAHGNTSGDQFSGNLDGGYDFHVSQALTLAPTAGLQYVRLDVNRFDETQAGAADLAVRDQTMDSLRSRLGGRLTFRKPINSCVAVALEARAAWQHEFLDDSRPITAEFINADLGPFTVHTTDPQRDAALVGTGLNATFYGRFTLFLDYDAQVGQASYLEQGGRGGLRVRF